jgi:hypothetical protein
LPSYGGGYPSGQPIAPGVSPYASVYPVPEQPTEPPSDDGQWVIAVYNDQAGWVWVDNAQAATKPGETPPSASTKPGESAPPTTAQPR